MTPAEAGVLLAGIAAFDNRKPGTPEEADRTATLWAHALHDITLADAGRAVTEHFATSTEWLMPAAIRATVLRVRRQRRLQHSKDHGPLLPPPGLSDAEEIAWLRQALERVSNGERIDCETPYGELVTSTAVNFRELLPILATDAVEGPTELPRNSEATDARLEGVAGEARDGLGGAWRVGVGHGYSGRLRGPQIEDFEESA